MTILPDCPEYWLHTCIHQGNWTSADVELFGPEEYGETTHIHFYTTIEAARKLWPSIKHLVPSTVTTVSFRN